MADTGQRWRVGIMGVSGTFVGASLIFLLYHRLPSGTSFLQLEPENFSVLGLAGILTATVVHCILTGRKWQLVTQHTTKDIDLGVGYYLYSALIALLGQVLPLQVAVLLGRSLTLRMHGQVPVRHSAACAVYDQLFDVLVPAIFLLPLPLHLSGVISLEAASACVAGLILFTGFFIAVRGEASIRLLIRIFTLPLPRRGKNFPFVKALREHRGGLFSRRVLLVLYCYSVLRFLNLALRAWLIAWTLGMNLPWSTIMFSSSIVTFSLLFSFVPGALGVVEWGWIGSIQLFGQTESIAVQYAIASRFLIVVSLLFLNLVHGVVLGGYFKIARKTVSPRSSK